MLDIKSVKPFMSLDSLLQSLILVRLGQELGTDSATARAVAGVIDAVVNMIQTLTTP
jgi:short subunit fatty acids transporter